MTNSKEISVVTNANKTESVEQLTSIKLPVNHMLAALSCASDEETRYMICGVRVHYHEGTIRTVSTDGHRLFVGSTELEKGVNVPGWLREGVTIYRENLGPKIKMAAKLADSAFVNVAFGHNQDKVVITDDNGEATFKCTVVDTAFPDYLRLLSKATGGVTDTEDFSRGDFRPVGFSGQYLKSVGDVSKILGGKDATVNVFARASDQAAMLSFPESPGCIMVLMPKETVETVDPKTAALMAPAIKSTVAALKAHVTRNREAAGKTKDANERKAYEEKAAGFEQRIADIMGRTLDQKAIAAPAKTDAKASDKPAAPAKTDAKASDKPAAPAKTDAKASDKPAEPVKTDAKASKKPVASSSAPSAIKGETQTQKKTSVKGEPKASNGNTDSKSEQKTASKATASA